MSEITTDADLARDLAAWEARVAPLDAALRAAGAAPSTQTQRTPSRWSTGYILDESAAHPGAFVCWHWEESYVPPPPPRDFTAARTALAGYQLALAPLVAAGYSVGWATTARPIWSSDGEPYLVITPGREVPHG